MNQKNCHRFPALITCLRIGFGLFGAIRLRFVCVKFVAIFCLIFTTPAVYAQTVRALVIGIDDYVELQDLAGAVNDARDIATALNEAGVQDLVVLKDEQANRQQIEKEWNALMERSQSGDILVLTYAGHGGQEPERIPGSERDGLDEVLLLGGFRSVGFGTRERIFDDELNHWFETAGKKKVSRNIRCRFLPFRYFDAGG